MFDFSTPTLWAILPESLHSFAHLVESVSHPLPATRQNVRQSTAFSPSLSASSEEGALPYTLHGSVAVLEIEGIIHRKGGAIPFFGMHWSGQDLIRKSLEQALEDPKVHAILLSFDSPGGIAAGTKELADFIAQVSRSGRKPLYAYANGLCASAAYWLAAATGRVYAPRTASVGSIGVLRVHCDRSAANTAQGLRYTYITGGTHKAIGNEDIPLSSTDQAYLQSMVEELHEIFRADIAACMAVNTKKTLEWGEGQLFLADQALSLGLLNGIVPDKETLIAQIHKEILMDKEQFAKTHPELLAQIQAEAKSAALSEAQVNKAALEASAQEALTQQAANHLAIVRAIAGEASAAQFSALINAGFTATQVEALAPMLAPVSPIPPSQNSATTETLSPSRADILAGIRSVTPSPVNISAQIPTNSDSVQAAIERISGITA